MLHTRWTQIIDYTVQHLIGITRF